jgi:hypothetical protein
VNTGSSTETRVRGSYDDPAIVELLRAVTPVLALGSLLLLAMCSPSKADPCSQASILKKVIEQDERDRIAKGIERKRRCWMTSSISCKCRLNNTAASMRSTGK